MYGPLPKVKDKRKNYWKKGTLQLERLIFRLKICGCLFDLHQWGSPETFILRSTLDLIAMGNSLLPTSNGHIVSYCGVIGNGIYIFFFGNRTVAKRGKSKHLTKQLLDYERFIQKASWIRPQHSGLASLPSYVKHEPSVLGAPGNTLFSKSLQENNALKQHVQHQKKKKKKRRERVKAKYIFREIHILKF